MALYKVVDGIHIMMTPEEEQELIEWQQRTAQELAATEYIRLRQEAYLSIGEQLDMIYWDKVNGTNIWMEHISMVKEKYPKN
jgi:hypothetical protein